jgi:2-polyprenyl-3-methyl-5-hydroxy-6-metoxy-1,4-benzoquinol methylase
MRRTDDVVPSRCKICDSSRVRFYCRKQSANHYRCQDCGTIFQFPRPMTAAMIDYVNAKYKNGQYGEYVNAQEMKLDHFRGRMEKLRPYLKQGRLLDVGCSCGYFLQIAESEGYEIQGVEFSASAIAAADPAIRPRIRQASVDKLTMGDGGDFDVITAFDLIEHLDQPKDFLATVYTLLSPGGTLAISTPDAGHFLRYCMRSRWPMVQPMQHLTIFTGKAIHLALQTTGFEVLLSEKAYKTLSLAYLLDQIRELNPLLSTTLQACGRLLPRGTMTKYRHINIGELLVVARKRGMNSC